MTGYGKFGPLRKYSIHPRSSLPPPSLTVSVVSDGDDPLRPVPELGVRYDEGDDDREEHEGGAHHVDAEGLLEVLLLVDGSQGVEAGEGGALVEGAVEQVWHPLVVGQAVVGEVRGYGEERSVIGARRAGKGE